MPCVAKAKRVNRVSKRNLHAAAGKSGRVGKGFSWAAACVLLAVPFAPAPAAAAVATARAKAVTIRPLSLLKKGDLSFGNIIPGAAAGSVTVNPYTDAPAYVGVAGAGGAIGAARLVGSGTAGQLVGVGWSTAAFTLTRIGGGATMRVDSLTTNYVQYIFAGLDPRVIPADRVLDIRFGGRLLVGANQPEGVYEGTFAVTVDYY